MLTRGTRVFRGAKSSWTALAVAALAGSALGADFNGDGIDDLAIGVPLEDVGPAPIVDAGSVNVVYGSPGGLSTAVFAAQLWSQSSAGIVDVAEAGDGFGTALAAGDFNGDGIDDLAIGVPGEGLGAGLGDAGAIHVIYGSPGVGLSLAFPPQYFTQGMTGVEVDEASDAFGSALAAADFNGDGFDDLAIGVPGEDPPGGGLIDPGAVIVLYGFPGGLAVAAPPATLLIPAMAPDGAEAGDMFGSVLAAGDVDANGADDLAVGIPLEDVGAAIDAGAVVVFYAMPGPGLAVFALPPSFLVQPMTGDPAEPGDAFGSSVAMADFDMNGFADLAAGAPMEDFAGDVDTGMVNVYYGVGGALPFGPTEFITQDTPGVPDVTEPTDNFGASLAAGDFDGNFAMDLAVGAPGETIPPIPSIDGGAVFAIYAIPAVGLGLEPAAIPAEMWTQNSPGEPEATAPADFYGSAVMCGDFDGNGVFDMASGVPGEDVGGAPVIDGGCVNVNYSMPGLPPAGGLTPPAVGSQVWTQNSAGVPESAGAGDGAGVPLR